ncbi:CHD5 domain protein, partial [Rhizoctonia solani AG-3 Rhs1AP]
MYVIDLDNRVFTVNGVIHFKLDNLPSNDKLCDLFMRPERFELPAELAIVKSVDLWPPPRFDTAQAKRTYDQLRPLVVTLPDWGIPAWDTLTVSHHLSATLVETLVDDYTDDLALTHFPSVWHKVGLFCWQVANAAAPSHLSCPPLDVTPKSSSLYTRASLIKYPSSTHPSITGYMGGKGTLDRYCWFRGCLVSFCPRLDQPAYMMHQVGQMVEHLRKHGRTTEVGIVMSGWHVVAVAVDGHEVRHSPVVDLHDGKQLKDGVLLLMHLLAPAFTVSKTPWRNGSLIHGATNTSAVPEEIVEQIVHYIDSDTYTILPSVSQYFRSICLAHPRVGDQILLGYEGAATSGAICKGPVFKTRSTDSTSLTATRLVRHAKSVDNRLPLWRYRAKCYTHCVLRPGLGATFQHLQVGTGPLWRLVGGRERIFFRDVIRGNKYSEMRIQALDGLWVMVPAKDIDKLRPNLAPHPNGIDHAERMTGFDREDLVELSEDECEGRWQGVYYSLVVVLGVAYMYVFGI